MKRNIDDFDGMKDFIISIVSAIAWFLIVTTVVVGYFTVETKGESIVISFISMFFTIISSLGIFATIGVYFKQKKDTKENKRKTISAMKSGLLHDIAISRKFLLFLKRAALNGRRKNNIANDTPNNMHCIKIQEMAPSSLIFINEYHVNVMIPKKDITNSICSASHDVDAFIYQSSINTLNLIDKITIMYTHVKLKFSNDLLKEHTKVHYVNIAAIEDIKSTCSILLNELDEIKRNISSYNK
ncbi:hypothetical protein [Morganella morganii]|uniref:hypothetical protein n=1 Tax=Morganella morganii TaxID=582 RepID=UPI001648D5D4|nr:hypothetical protein [Morganella morganii]MBC4002702.1 hypothetical protein [Morganella morganii]